MSKVSHRNTSYRREWEILFPWLREVEGAKSIARCIRCNSSFHINSSGKTQVKIHSNTKIHIELSTNNKTLPKKISGSAVSSVSKGELSFIINYVLYSIV